jgi:serine/threonine-protein kinase
MSLDEAAPIARQIAEALEAAHEAGIVHRDLKPANIKVRPDGIVKVLDFGLAKALDPASGSDTLSASTMTSPAMTLAGVILGTAAYMAPEQAKGRAVDKRADIWAFGCVLFEMLAGRRPFGGEDLTDIITAIMRDAPAWTSLPRDTPSRVRDLLARCLEKDPRKRLRDIGEARVALEGDLTAAVPSSSNDKSAARPRRWPVAAVALSAAAGVALGAAAMFLSRTAPAVPGVVRSTIPLSPTAPLSLQPNMSQSIAMSPDGRRLVYVTRQGLSTALMARDMEAGTAELLPGSQGADRPFFSPGGDFIGFVVVGERMMKKLPARGGTPIAIGSVPALGSASWGDDDWIVLQSTTAVGLSRIKATGGALETLTTPDRVAREKTHRFPEVLPGGRAVVYTVGSADLDTYFDARIVVRDLKSGETHTLIEGGSCARFVEPGFLVYAKAGSLWAVAFDAGTLRTSGTPMAVQGGVSMGPQSGEADFAVSRNGVLVYAAGAEYSVRRRLLWVNRQGDTKPIVDEEGSFGPATLSDDGRRLFVDIEQANDPIYAYDLVSGSRNRLTKGWDAGIPALSEDGRLLFRSDQGGDYWRLFAMPAAGGDAELLLDREVNWLDDRSRHGVLAVQVYDAATQYDIWLVSLTSHKATPLLAGKDGERSPALSPNGRLLAYVSDRSKPTEVFVIRVDKPGEPIPVSSGGGSLPRWANDRELFYTDGSRIKLVRISEGPDGLASDPPQALPFDVSRYAVLAGSAVPFFNVTPDGRFIMIEQLPGTAPPNELNLVTNWATELKRKLGGR